MTEMDRRTAGRVAFRVSAVIEAGNKRIESESTEDLSVKGVFINCSESLEPETQCKVFVNLSGSSSNLTLEIEAVVARVVAGKGVGIKFTSVDLDSYIFLKDIVEHNEQVELQKGLEEFDNDD